MFSFYKYFYQRPFLYHFFLSLSIFIFLKQKEMFSFFSFLFSVISFSILFYMVKKIYESILFHFFIKENQKQIKKKITKIFYFYSFLFFLLVPFSAVNYFFDASFIFVLLLIIFFILSYKAIYDKFQIPITHLILSFFSAFLLLLFSSFFSLIFLLSLF